MFYVSVLFIIIHTCATQYNAVYITMHFYIPARNYQFIKPHLWRLLDWWLDLWSHTQHELIHLGLWQLVYNILYTCIPFVQELVKKSGTCMIFIWTKYYFGFFLILINETDKGIVHVLFFFKSRFVTIKAKYILYILNIQILREKKMRCNFALIDGNSQKRYWNWLIKPHVKDYE